MAGMSLPPDIAAQELANLRLQEEKFKAQAELMAHVMELSDKYVEVLQAANSATQALKLIQELAEENIRLAICSDMHQIEAIARSALKGDDSNMTHRRES